MLSYKVRIVQLNVVQTKIRTKIVEGVSCSLPKIGESFVLLGAPLERGFTTRWVNTSPIIRITELVEDKEWEILTESGSRYRIELLETLKQDALSSPSCLILMRIR